jgi:threonine dehydrogenase-like Zn-dependent dehydrogenase
MRAAVLNAGQVAVREIAEPVPGPGQVLVRVRACGICGSDLHFARHGGRLLALDAELAGGRGALDPDAPALDLDRDVYLGHEFAAEVLATGPDTEATVAEGTLVTSVPVLLRGTRIGTGAEPIIYSNSTYGGYGERMLLSAPLLLPVPNGLPAHLAALTEPMAVGLHAVNRSAIRPGEGALVLGCGPVGLAVIAALKLAGIGPIVATDYSPARRALAVAMGADLVVDPRQEDGWAAWTRTGGDRQLVVFEAIGVPGILNDILRSAPRRARVVVVGVCMENDAVNPYFGVVKELSIQFVFGYEVEEFARSLRALAEGEIDAAPLVTARIPLDRVPWAFEALGDPEQHCKIIIEP